MRLVPFLFPILVFGLATLLPVGAAAAEEEHHHHDDPHQDGHADTDERPDLAEHLSGSTGPDFDVHYLLMMTSHHRSGIELAKIAQERAQHDETKNLARAIISEQQHEIDQMTAMLTQRGKEPGAGHANFRAYADAQLALVRNTPKETIDQVFLEVMDQHHHDAIAAAALADSHAADPALKEMAAKAAAQQKVELATMSQLHRSWFGTAMTPIEATASGATAPQIDHEAAHHHHHDE